VSHKVLDLSNDFDELAEDHAHSTVTHEVIAAAPMSIDEAVMQLELSEERNVLFFTNAETDALNAVYRRSNGTISWIEPGEAN